VVSQQQVWLSTLIRRVILFASFVFLFGCGSQDYPQADSPSGAYSISTSKSEKGLVSIYLTNAQGVELHEIESSASDFIKWSIGWMPDEDVVVLQSSDVGTRAYDIIEGRLVERPDAYKDEKISNRAEELYEERYK